MTLPVPLPRWGVRFTNNPIKDQDYVQTLYDDDNSQTKRGELFLNELYEELYYVGADGVARTVNGTNPVLFSRINFTGHVSHCRNSKGSKNLVESYMKIKSLGLITLSVNVHYYSKASGRNSV
jgi:hypothetical protein